MVEKGKKRLIRVLDAHKNNPQKSLAPPPPSGLPWLVDWPDWVILEVRGEKSGGNVWLQL